MSTVDKQHPGYIKFSPKWRRCRDAYNGQDAMHEAGQLYLPKLKSEDDDDYKARLKMTGFYNATKRTHEGLKGLLYRKPPLLDVPANGQQFVGDITNSGEALITFANEVSAQDLLIGRVGIIVDAPQDFTGGMTLSDLATSNIRPFLKIYPAESIINWRYERINNRTMLSMVVLKEQNERQKNEFEQEIEVQYRVLDLSQGYYRQRVFEIDDLGNDVLLSETTPLVNGRPLFEMPFYLSDDGDIGEPPLLDLVNINIAHYRVTSDYETGCHFCGIPTAFITGYQKENQNEKLYLGSPNAYCLPDPGASAFFLEFSGQGLGALENNLAKKEEQMAILGARLLAGEKRAVEAAETVAIRRANENSVLENIAQEESKTLNKALTMLCQWAGIQPITIELNRDFIGTPLSSQDITALVDTYLKGGISQETLYYNLKAGELYPDDMTFEEEQAKITNAPIV